MVEKYRVTIGKQITKEKTLDEAIQYLSKLREMGIISLGLELESVEIEKKQPKSKVFKKTKQTKVKSVQKKFQASKLFPKEVDKFIEKNWLTNSDKLLKQLIEKEFGIVYTVGQIKTYRRRRGLVSSGPGSKKAVQQKYPNEMKEFIEKNMNQNSSQQLCKLITEKFGFKITLPQLSRYMYARRLKRENPNRQRAERREGRPSKFTDEVVKFLKENINNSSNEKLCKELKSRFNVETTPISLRQTMSNRGIKRDFPVGVGQDIIDFIIHGKKTDPHEVRDAVIEKFERNMSMTDIRRILNGKVINSKEESVEAEVKRIKEQREVFADDEDIDGLELDN